MDRPSLLVIVRHAESVRNKIKGRNVYFADDDERESVRGIPDHEIHITDEGVAQAEQAGVLLRKRFGKFHYAYHSGYLRTVQTLEGILRAYPDAERAALKVRLNPFIRERDPGYTYDMTQEEADKAFPFLKEHWQTFGGFLAYLPGGESLAQMAERIELFLTMLFRDRVGQKVLVVTHGGTIRCLRFLIEHWDYDQARKWPEGQSPKNCGITVYKYDTTLGRLVLKEYNTIA